MKGIIHRGEYICTKFFSILGFESSPMVRTKTGFKSILSFPWFYNLFQNLLGARHAREELMRTYVQPKKHSRILDIGCGTGEILEHLSDAEYLGFDISAKYIAMAQKRYGNRGTFQCEDVSNASLEGVPPFDLAISIAVLHHLNDEEATALFAIARSALKIGGRLVTIDPTFTEEQSVLARFLVKHDRGQHVRTPEGYRNLAVQIFPNVRVEVRHDLLTVPYTHAILEASSGV